MTRAKNYKTMTKCVKVMPRILWPLFSPDTMYIETAKGLYWTCYVREAIKTSCNSVWCT